MLARAYTGPYPSWPAPTAEACRVRRRAALPCRSRCTALPPATLCPHPTACDPLPMPRPYSRSWWRSGWRRCMAGLRRCAPGGCLQWGVRSGAPCWTRWSGARQEGACNFYLLIERRAAGVLRWVLPGAMARGRLHTAGRQRRNLPRCCCAPCAGRCCRKTPLTRPPAAPLPRSRSAFPPMNKCGARRWRTSPTPSGCGGRQGWALDHARCSTLRLAAAACAAVAHPLPLPPTPVPRRLPASLLRPAARWAAWRRSRRGAFRQSFTPWRRSGGSAPWSTCATRLLRRSKPSCSGSRWGVGAQGGCMARCGAEGPEDALLCSRGQTTQPPLALLHSFPLQGVGAKTVACVLLFALGVSAEPAAGHCAYAPAALLAAPARGCERMQLPCPQTPPPRPAAGCSTTTLRWTRTCGK